MLKKDDLFHFFKKKSTIILLFSIGFLFMVGTSMMPANEQASVFQSETFKKNEEVQKGETVKTYEEVYEEKLQQTLEEMAGIEDVTVLITLETTDVQVPMKNKKEKKQITTETDKQGGRREIEDYAIDDEIVVERMSGEERPFIIREDKPKVRGVLIVAKGVEIQETKSMVIEAVSRTLNIGSHRISVQPKEDNS